MARAATANPPSSTFPLTASTTTTMSRRAPNMSNNAAITTAHTLSLLGEYTHSLDSLPLDLSRSFGDLRELDAVLSLSMTTLTTKINQLTTMLEKNMMSKEDRLWLLVDIAEEAARLKAGNDDKIRVACYAADNIKGHKAHMKTLIEHVPDHDFGSIQLLGRKTVFPHVATRSYMPVGGTGEGGRRQRRAAYLSVGGVDASPNKRKRAGGRDEDPDVVGKTPRKERAGDGARQRNAARNKRVVERAASPTESLVSVASHLPTATQGGSATNGRTANGNANNKRSRATNNAHDASTQERAHQDLYSGPPSSSTTHPSLAIPFSNNISALNGVHVANGASEWTHGQLEGPGMPVARTVVSSTTVVETVDSAGDTVADVDAEGDDGRIYCFCNRPSFGDMIACDDPICEREWFHLPCVGLKEAPLGGWYCDTCRAKRARRNGRGGKKKTGGNRTNTRNTST